MAFLGIDIDTDGQSPARLVKPIVIGALLGAVGFNLWHLFPETTGGALAVNDSLFHLLLAESAVDAISHGRDFTDAWHGRMSLGFPVFHHYQHLPHVSLALLNFLTFKVFPLIDLMRWATYLLISLFPLSIFWSLRRFKFDPITCAMGAVVASLIGNDFQLFGGFGYENYTFDGRGLYTQLWGMFLLPVSLAMGYRTIRTGQGYLWAVLLLSATLLAHLVYGYMAFLTLGFLAFIPPAQWTGSRLLALAVLAHWKRLAILLVCVLLATMYFTVPLSLDNEYFSGVEGVDQVVLDSFGHQVVLETLAKGDLFDLGRFPSLSILAAFGVAGCLFFRSSIRYMVPLVLFFAWLLLFFGRSTWGPVMDLLPLSQDVYMHRFIGGVHLGGIFLAAVALALPWRWAVSRGNNGLYVAGALVLTLLVLSPVYVERRSYLSDKAVEKQENQMAQQAEQADIDEIIDTLKGLPPGRVFAGLTPESGDRWGLRYQIGGTPVAQLLGAAGLDVFSTTLHTYSLPSNVVVSFDETSAGQYDLFNIRYVVVPANSQMPGFMTPLKKIGRHRLYQVQTTGYFDLVGSGLSFDGGKSDYSSAANSWLAGGLLGAKLHPQVSIDGSPGPQKGVTRPSTVDSAPGDLADLTQFSGGDLDRYAAGASVGPPRGLIVSEAVGTDYYSAEVDVQRDSMLLLKATFHPNWRATVNGETAETLMLMPGFLGVQLEPGQHEVLVEYRPGAQRKVLLVLGLLSLLLIPIWEKRGATIWAWLGQWVPAAGIGKTIEGRSSRAGRRRRTRRSR